MIRRLRFDKYSALYLWALFMVVFGITQGSTFLSWTSFKLVLIDPAVFTGTLALAFLVPLATGTFDLSIGANMSMSLVISALAGEQRRDAGPGGDVRGARRVRGRRVHQRLLRRPAQGQQLHRHARHESGDHRVRSCTSRASRSTTRSPTATATSGVTRCSACRCSCTTWRRWRSSSWYVFEHTPIGRHMFATGGNLEAARLAGLRTDRLIWGVARRLGGDRRIRRDDLRLEGRQLRADGRSGLPVPGDRRRVLRRLAAQGPAERVGHVHRPVRAGVGDQGAPTHVHRQHPLDRAAVPGPLAARRRVARQPPGRRAGAQEQGGSHRGAARRRQAGRPPLPRSRWPAAPSATPAGVGSN